MLGGQIDHVGKKQKSLVGSTCILEKR